jgi:hypothetical protein
MNKSYKTREKKDETKYFFSTHNEKRERLKTRTDKPFRAVGENKNHHIKPNPKTKKRTQNKRTKQAQSPTEKTNRTTTQKNKNEVKKQPLKSKE